MSDMKKALYVYILECADDSFYVGVTNNVGRRYIEHSSGIHEEAYTISRRPLKLVFCRQFNNPMNAIRFEKQVKGWTKAKKIALINGDHRLLHELAKCKNETSHTNFHKSVRAKPRVSQSETPSQSERNPESV